MGTHPIFESDFDCLTDFCAMMATWPIRSQRQEHQIDRLENQDQLGCKTRHCQKGMGCCQHDRLRKIQVDETQASQKQNRQPRSRKIAKAEINLYSTPLTRLYSDWLNSKLPRETKKKKN